MNICIESHLLNHHKRSGVMTYTEGLVNGMSANDLQNDYTLLYYSLTRGSDSMPGPNGKNLKKEVLKIPDRSFWGRKFIIDNVYLPAFFRKNKIDVFHRAVGYTMPNNKNVFKILTVHDLRTLTIGDRYLMQDINLYKKTLSNIDMCVTVSECTKRDLIKHLGLDETKIKVVYLGVDERYRVLEKEHIDEVKSKFGITKPFFLSVGSVPRKNIGGIIRGFAGCKHRNDYQLVLNCRMDIEKYKELCSTLGVRGNVVFVNNVSDEDLVALFNACHCFVFPSLYEGFGLPILEAMKCGAPVLTSNISACPEVTGDAALIVDPNNIDEISDALNEICQNYALLKYLRFAGSNTALSLLSHTALMLPLYYP